METLFQDNEDLASKLHAIINAVILLINWIKLIPKFVFTFCVTTGSA